MAKLEPKRNARKKNDLSINKRKRKQKIQAKGSIEPKKLPNKQHLRESLKKKPSPTTKKSKPNRKVTVNSNKIKKAKNKRVIKHSNKRIKTQARFTGAQKKKVLQKIQKNNVKKGLDVKLLKAKRKIKDSEPKRNLIKNENQLKGSLKVKSQKAEKEDAVLMKKFKNIKRHRKEAQKQDCEEFSDPTQLVNLETVYQAISGIRKLRDVAEKSSNNLLDTSGDDSLIFLQVTISKMPYVVKDQHLVKPRTIKMYLPNSLVNDETEIILITRDLERGIRPDHEQTLNFYQELLRKHSAASLVSEIIPLRQLKVEYKEFEAKRNLSRRVDVVLCDDTVLRFIPKFLGKHFYEKKKSPVQVNLKAKNLHHELKRALSVSQLIFTMHGNCALMKVGRLSLTDEAIAANILAVVQKLANRVPGKWKNVQNLSLKLEKSKSVPFFVSIGSLNDVGVIHPRPYFKTDPVSGTLTTCPRKCVTVFPDGSVTVQNLAKNKKRIPVEEREKPKKVTKKLKAKQKVKRETKGEVETGEEKSKTEIKELKKLETRKSIKVQRDPASKTEVESTKRRGEAGEKSKAKKQKVESAKKRSEPGKKSKTKKQKVSKKEDSDSGEEELEAQELAYLKKRNEEQEGEKGTSAEEEEGSEADDDSDPWDEESDYDSVGSYDEELY